MSNERKFRFRTNMFGKVILQFGEDRRCGLEEDGPEYILWRDARLEDLPMIKQIKLDDGVTDLDEPNTRAGYCPTCSEPANIWAQGMWHCGNCNWSGIRPAYEVHKSVIERLEGRR